MNAHTWTTYAACAARRDLPWTGDAADASPWQLLTMRHLCDTCPVAFDCLAAVDELDVTGGFWAGADRDSEAEQLALGPEWLQVGAG